MADDRSPRPRPPFRGDRPDRPPFGTPRPPFRQPSFEPQAPHTLRLRDGEREIEVTGTAVFVRQVLDDLPALIAKLRGDSPLRPAAIRMPAAEEPAPADVLVRPPEAPRPPERNGSIEERVLAVLREARKPMAVAAIRKRLGPQVTPQQVRRVLERAGERVAVSGQRPATYRLTDR